MFRISPLHHHGRTIEEIDRNIREAIELCLEDLKELGEPVPDATNTLVGSVVVMF